jgi:hypothetical protein
MTSELLLDLTLDHRARAEHKVEMHSGKHPENRFQQAAQRLSATREYPRGTPISSRAE